MEIQTRARLVEPSFAGGVTTTLPRAEIERAVAEGEFPAWLELRVKRQDDAGEDEAQVAVAWDEQELEQLLRAADSDGVTLMFDGASLADALEEPDVEAHGLRERTAVLAIAVMAAGASAGIASAHNQGPSSGGAQATAAVTSDSVVVPAGSKYVPQAGQTVVTVGGERTTSGIGTAASKTVDSTDAVAVPAGSKYVPQAGQTEVVIAGTDSRGVAATGADATAIQPDAVAVPAGSKYVPQAGQTEVVVGGDSRGVAATAADSTPINQPDTVLVPPGAKYVPAAGETMITAPTSQVGSGSAATGVTVSESSSLSATDDAAIAAGAVLLIAAAGFAATQAGRRPPRPA
jgi:hypothetical protein